MSKMNLSLVVPLFNEAENIRPLHDTIHDVVTDIRQIPVPFPENDLGKNGGGENEDEWTSVFRGQGLALCGMASAAVNLFREHIDSLVYLAKQGYRIRLTGHSMGGGVAAMMGVLVLRHLERHTDLGPRLLSSGTPDETDLLRVYAYGTPSCVDAQLAGSVDSFVTTVILHDDVFPRLTPTSCRGLLKHLLHIRETWVKPHIEEDLRAVGERAKTVWAPKFRQPFTLSSSSRSIKKYCKKQMQKGKSKLMSKIQGDSVGEIKNDTRHTSIESNDSFAEGESFASDPSDWGEKFFVPTSSGASVAQSLETTFEDAEEGVVDENDDTSDQSPQLLLEFLGGGDTDKQGIVIDGDEFFDTEDKLVESDGEASCDSSDAQPLGDPLPPDAPDNSLTASDSWSVDIQADESGQAKKASGDTNTKDESSSDNEPSAVVLEETPLPRMFVPGKVIHIYSHRGVYKATYVPRTFRELRRISLAGNMLSNHSTKSYYESLLEVQTARVAPERPPKWTAFDEDDTW